jgi:hypothetical protein
MLADGRVDMRDETLQNWKAMASKAAEALRRWHILNEHETGQIGAALFE